LLLDETNNDKDEDDDKDDDDKYSSKMEEFGIGCG